jgi:hypothetical protein
MRTGDKELFHSWQRGVARQRPCMYNPPFTTRFSLKLDERHVVRGERGVMGMKWLFQSVAGGAGYKLGVIDFEGSEARDSSSRRCRDQVWNRETVIMAKVFLYSD